jgi:hypothetical protein
LKQENCEFEGSLDYIERPQQQQKKKKERKEEKEEGRVT